MEILEKTNNLYTWLSKINSNFKSIDEKLKEDIIADDLKVKDGYLYSTLGGSICKIYSSNQNIDENIDTSLFLYGIWDSSRIGLNGSSYWYVQQIFGDDITNSSKRIQIAYSSEGLKIYGRGFNGTSWSAWVPQNENSEIDEIKEKLEELEGKISENTGAISANTASIESLSKRVSVNEESLQIHTKRIENLTAAAQGKNFTFQTDADAAYSKLVPTGALPYAGVKSIGGKTVVWNQLIPDISKRNWNVFCTKEILSNGNVKITCNRESSYFGGGIATLNLINGHKYLYKAVISNSYFYDSTIKYNKQILTTKDGTNYRSYYADSVFTVNYDSYTYGCSFYISTPNNSINFNIGDWVKIKSIMLIDLTLMFGSGNEPSTVEEFEAMFPADYYEYNAGELLSAGVSEVQSVGKNLIKPIEIDSNVYFSNCESYAMTDDILQVKGTLKSESSPTSWSNGWVFFGIKNNKYEESYIFLNKNDIVTFSVKINILNDAFPDKAFLDKFVLMLTRIDGAYSIVGNGTQQDGDYAVRTFTVPANGFYRFTLTTSACTLELSEVMITKTDERIDYVPYKETVASIPAEVQLLEGYGWSAGDAKNWIDWENRVYHREVASVDLGTMNWGIQNASSSISAYMMRTDSINNLIKKHESSALVSNIICNKYPTSNAGDAYYGAYGISVNTTGRVIVYDPAYNTADSASAFKAAMAGVMLYYELAEPEFIDISDLLTADNLIETEAGGMLIFKNQHGEDFRIPVPSEVEHMIDIEEAL